MKKALTSSPRYRSFVTERNKVLEYLLDHYLTKVDHTIGELHELISMLGQHLAHVLADHNDVRVKRHFMDAQLFKKAHEAIVRDAHRLRLTAYSLAYLSEAEAIGRALGKKQRVNLDAAKISRQLDAESPSGGTLGKRLELGMNRLMRKVQDAVELTLINGDTPEQMQERIDLAFPRKKRLVYPVRKLPAPKLHKKIHEADFDPEDDEGLVTGFIDDDTWEQIVDDYMAANIPKRRGPTDLVTYPASSGKTKERYAWEVEQEITQDFLDQVRGGQVDAAQENGVTDFQWIAIIDQKTDDCCQWRDGLTSSEIRAALRSEHSGDDCDAEVPPAHFNCRCDLAPMTEDMPETPPEELGDFETWLTT